MATSKKTPVKAARVPEVLPAAEPAEVSMVKEHVTTLGSWIAGMVPFFRTAGELRKAGEDRLAEAKRLGRPSTNVEDEHLQRFIVDSKAGAKRVLDHFNPVSVALDRLHKAVTGSRSKVAEGWTAAADVAQRNHNDFAEEQRRLAREEDERRRREAEQQAREAQQREAAELERKAIEAEEASADLSERERIFVERVAAGMGAQQAATVARFADPLKSAARLMTLKKITTAINGLKDAAAMRRQAETVKERPIVVKTEAPTVGVSRAAGVRDNTTWSAVVTDEAALIEAVFQGEVPRDVLMIDQVRLNRYARELHELVNAWPGVEATSTTRTV